MQLSETVKVSKTYINKICPKFHFLTKIEIKMSHLALLFC